MAPKNSDKPTLNIKGMRIANVRKLGKSIAFSLLGNGLGLYSLRVVSGKNGYFISPPQVEGKDRKWYNIYAVYFSEADEERIIKKVLESVPDEDDADEGEAL